MLLMFILVKSLGDSSRAVRQNAAASTDNHSGPEVVLLVYPDTASRADEVRCGADKGRCLCRV